jgi:hypothetical protein
VPQLLLAVGRTLWVDLDGRSVRYEADMDSYTTSAEMGALPKGTAPRIVPNPSPIQISRPVNPLVSEVITG